MTEHAPSIPWSQWLNVLGLDAPLVILGWTVLFSSGYGAPALHGSCASIFLGIWAGYIMDRWLDARRIPVESIVTYRHRFAYQHSKKIFVAGIIISGASAILGWISFSREVFWMAVLLLAVASLYFLKLASSPKTRELRKRTPVKEISVSVILAGAAIVPLGWRPLLQAPFSTALCGAALALLYFQNCALVASWDQPTDEAQQQIGYFTLRKQSSLVARWVGPSLLVTLVVIGTLFPKNYQLPTPVLLAFILSSASLEILQIFRGRIPLDSRRALADLALMCAWLF
jgi:hypothetical protein